MSTSGLRHAVIEQNNLEKRKSRRNKGSRTATLRRAPSDSDCSGETASLSADSDRHRPIPVAHATLHSRSNRRRGSEWEVLEGLKDGQRFERRPEVFNGYLHKKRKWPLKGWHKRFFVIDGGILVYARSPTDVARGRLHGSVDVGLSVISAKNRRRRIDIDADEFIYHLRAKTPDVFRTWLAVLKAHRLYRQHLLTFGARESVPKAHLPKEDIAATDTSSRETVTRTTSSSLSNTSEQSMNSSLRTYAAVSTYKRPDRYNSNPFSLSFNTLCTRTKGKDGSFCTGCSDYSVCNRTEIISKNGRKGIKLPKKEVVFICDDETDKSESEEITKSEFYNIEKSKKSCFGFKTLCHCNKVDIRPTYFFFAKHRRKVHSNPSVRLPKSKKCTNIFKYRMNAEPITYNQGICVLKKRKQIACHSNQTSFHDELKPEKELSRNTLLEEDFVRDYEPYLNSIASETVFIKNNNIDVESVDNKEGSSKCDYRTEVSQDSTKQSIEGKETTVFEVKSRKKLEQKCSEKLSKSLYSSDYLLESAIHECVGRNFSKARRIKHIDKIFSKMALKSDKADETNNQYLTENVSDTKDSVHVTSSTDPKIVVIPTLFPKYNQKPTLELPGWNLFADEVELQNRYYVETKKKVINEVSEDKATKFNANAKCNMRLKTDIDMPENESCSEAAEILNSSVWDALSENYKDKTLEFSISNYKTAKVLVNRDSNCEDITVTLKLHKGNCKKKVDTATPETSNKSRYCSYQVPKPKYFSPFMKTHNKEKSFSLKHADKSVGNSEESTENKSKQNELASSTQVIKTSTTDTTSTNYAGKRKLHLKKHSDLCALSKKSLSMPRKKTSSSMAKLKQESRSDCGTHKILTLFVNKPKSVDAKELKKDKPAIPIPFNYATLNKIINIKSSSKMNSQIKNHNLSSPVEKLNQTHDKSVGASDEIIINVSTTTSMSGLISTDVKEISVVEVKETKEQATMPGSVTKLDFLLESLSSATTDTIALTRKVYSARCLAHQQSKSSLNTLKNPSNSSSVRSFCLPLDEAFLPEKAIQATPQYNEITIDLAVNTDFDSDPPNTELESDPDLDNVNKYIGSCLHFGGIGGYHVVPPVTIQTELNDTSSDLSSTTKTLKEVGSNTTGHIKLFHKLKKRNDKYYKSYPEMSDFSDQVMLEDAYAKSCSFEQNYYHTFQVLIDEKVAVTSVEQKAKCSHVGTRAKNRCKGDIEPQAGLISPCSPTLRGPQAGFVSGTPGGRLASWIVESGGPLENASREIGQAQLSVQQLQRLLDALEMQQQMHHDTDVSLEGASPNVKKDRRKFGLRKKKSNTKCASIELAPPQLEVSGSHMALSALTAPPSPGGGMPSSVPNSAASLPMACSAVRPQSLPGAESLTGTSGVPLSSFTPEHQLREDFAVLAKDLLASLKSVVGTLVSERSRLRVAMDSADQGTPTNSAFVAALRNNLNTALQQNSELRSRLSRIHDTSDIGEMSSMGHNSDPVPRHLRQSMSFSSSCVSASEFFDAEAHSDDPQDNHIIAANEAGVIELDGDSSSEAGSLSSEDGASASSDNSEAGCPPSAAPAPAPAPAPASAWSRRAALPAPRASPQGPSLWNLLYKNIGKDLSQVSMPVTINEPLNMLQRLCEELEYSELLDAAAKCQEPMERMCLVAAFAVSAYASSSHRAASKPFNPLLGETYECRRTDRDFVFLAEQVSHHPPISACHAESPRWVFWQEARIKTKFWGKSMEFQPCSRVHVKLKTTGDHYTWNKVTTCVHNLFGGQRWVDQYGDMHITCHGADITCKLNFVKASSWSTSRHEVRGFATALGSKRVPLTGRWSEALYAGEPPHNRCLWRPGAMPAEHELYYGFTRFAMELNELEPDMVDHLPPTDTRLRPDQRALEEGDIDAAEQYKYQLEEAQRERRRDKNEPSPKWFHKSYENGEEMWMFNNEYWKAREAGFPDHSTRLW